MIQIGGFQKVTLLDYPDQVACIVFTVGCNYRCPFCQNSELVLHNKGIISEEEVLDYLNKRKGILDGVVISGGEPTVQKDLKDFIIKIKKLGLLVKLDTNGTNPELLKDLIDNNLIDYVAMDIKNDLDKYKEITINNPEINKIKKSIKLLQDSKIDHEFRTTIMKNYHTIADLQKICQLVDGDKYYLQNFKDSEYVLGEGLEAFTYDELKNIQDELQKQFTNVNVRDL
jgi:pyruvate formate lyase activating enzyme